MEGAPSQTAYFPLFGGLEMLAQFPVRWFVLSVQFALWSPSIKNRVNKQTNKTKKKNKAVPLENKLNTQTDIALKKI